MSVADPVRAIADAVLYEGYILWPYRRSALKNQRRFTFGGIHPPAHSDRHPDDRDAMCTEVLWQGESAGRVELAVRFLHVVQRQVMRRQGERLAPVDELVVNHERYVSWEEAVEREVRLGPVPLSELRVGVTAPIGVEAGRRTEDLGGEGAIVRSWEPLRGQVRAMAVALQEKLWRVSVEVRNKTPGDFDTRERALACTFCSTHTLLHTVDGTFVSATDPPPELAAAARECRNVGTWPVLVGERGDRRTVLSSPIILEEYPRVAPESPGDLFDGGEIDQLLILNILALTGEEKAEMAAADPRAAEILRRCEALTPGQLMALHGLVREVGLTR